MIHPVPRSAPSDAPIVVVGDALLDRDLVGTVERICPDAPAPVLETTDEVARPGGAALAAVLATGHGRPVVLVTALGSDAAGRELAELLSAHRVEVVDLGADGATVEKVRVRAGGQSLVRIDRGNPSGPIGRWTSAARSATASAAAVLVADYGRGMAAHFGVRAALADLPRRVPVVWDPHPRGPDPVPGVHLVTPNDPECRARVPDDDGRGLAAVAQRALELRERWSVTAVGVTLGASGALLVTGDGPPLVVPPPFVAAGDTCGAGDRFAAAAVMALADGAVLSEAVVVAVASAAEFVAAGGAGALREPPGGRPEPATGDIDLRAAGDAAGHPPHRAAPDATALSEAVRARGGTVVATGGCFDLLHAGHVASLQAARSLGDCLVVCLNSDASVRRLKGPDRPLQSENDRARVLLALDCVDAVVVFDEATPAAALRSFRPHLFAKGADYAIGDLPEAATLAEWGGHAVVLPYLPGRSTSRLVEEARRRVP
jgi:D-beta-D-heptose 7-phosphate kinase / D-beta-D-heptose 1-phosphate adenosyltransferase